MDVDTVRTILNIGPGVRIDMQPGLMFIHLPKYTVLGRYYGSRDPSETPHTIREALIISDKRAPISEVFDRWIRFKKGELLLKLTTTDKPEHFKALTVEQKMLFSQKRIDAGLTP